MIQAVEDAYAASSVPAVFRSRRAIEDLFTDFELVEPGIVPVGRRRDDEPDTHIRILAGVGRVPTP